MGVYEDLPKVSTRDVHFGRLPSDESHSSVAINKTQSMDRGTARFHGESATGKLYGAAHDGPRHDMATTAEMRNICNRSLPHQGARWDSAPGGWKDLLQANDQPSLGFTMSSTQALQGRSQSSFGANTVPFPSGSQGLLSSNARTGRRAASAMDAAPPTRGHDSPPDTPAEEFDYFAGPRVCKPGMEGLGINLALGTCKWDELLSTKARRNALGNTRSAWEILESNFEVEARENRESKTLEHAKNQVRRASVVAMNNPSTISGNAQTRRRNSLVGQLEALAHVQEHGAKGKSGRLRPQLRRKRGQGPFGQTSALYGRGTYNEGMMKH